ncbi:serine/threonine protein kinase [[Leptolyngbya] sp. PCC 7376]|uniref:serine/threonine-protein kinase n=1 Tax=[Leptolyngbya] sp. PCC 7376 TaxID=111781 RepID=UPI00029EE1D3|nr:serine/threonine-protein kinase [[Leptolyngbya] sp. PCC 7376]AFY37835.1 serine/threonine protein kinase [[Leptolyngbya] sp. PCC 7376]
MSYCINPECENPKNPLRARTCQACGSSLFLHDRYKPLKSLGKGGFGATFLAVDLSLPGKPSCVIKQLRPSTNVPHLFEMARELFEREAQTLGRIGNHPQVPRLLDYFETDKQFYLVQEYVKGNNLQQEVKKNGVFSEAGARQFLSEILPMVQYIHSQQVIHRDIKPANLIRREQDKKLVLIDFGAVKNRVNPEEAANTSDQTALTSFAVGTPGYAPPEQMAMRPVYASDIYAIGITCLYLLTGKSPKDLDYNPNTGEMMWESFVDISNSFASVLRKMLESSVKHRYQSAEDALNALDMEPYMESLAQGLSNGADGDFAGTTGGVNDPNSPTSDDDATGGPSTSANSRLAMAIRARRDRRKGTGSVRQGLGSRGGQGGAKKNTLNRMAPGAGATPHKSSSSRFKSKNKTKGSGGKNSLGKLDAKALQNAYKKGRRDFGQQNLLSISLPQSNLSGCIFHQSRMMRANFQGANLSNADFGKANLASANLRDANLGRAYFSYTNLSKADLRGADLSYAYLNYAIVDGTNLCGANLTNAKITEDQLKKAKTNWATIMPNGKRGLF